MTEKELDDRLEVLEQNVVWLVSEANRHLTILNELAEARKQTDERSARLAGVK